MRRKTFHPGVFLQELIQWQKITPKELAEQTGIPSKRILEITQQKAHLDSKTSEGLADYFGNSSGFWMNLQNAYDSRQPAGEITAWKLPSS
ncbi:MAG: HigA family addiction module antitoxin [Pseudomonadota bacterium]